MDHSPESNVRSDRVGKVFCMVGGNLRQCMICDELFTCQAAAAHARTACFPKQRSCELVGEINDGDRRSTSNCVG